MTDKEKLHFKLGIGGTYWRKVPIYSILVNDQLIQTTEIKRLADEMVRVNQQNADIKKIADDIRLNTHNLNS